ncbi:FtsX-like permease family protein [Faecalicatena contorta]|uniref:FtsX-like permease family protein n=1 Tax=Faecalicatena contorta TaxID=39482 RepID=A0A315ZTB2_9FIRM|nr:FtsX-like permease family protein [Faecalicatena contorta]PWJ48118.1 FtsX-like permease family protein [Faecalicatena contorta]SUQ15645.1 FtsX-like permease family protein [Faecalicatena contorta]
MQVQRKVERFRIVCGFLIFLSLLFQKMQLGESQFYSLWDIIFLISGPGDLDFSTKIHLYSLIPFVIMCGLFLFRSFWLLGHKNPKYFDLLPAVGLVVCFGYIVFPGFVQIYICVNLGIVCVDYMGTRWLEERDAINAAYEKQKEEDRAEKANRKRIRYFPGKYPEEFFRVVQKNFTYGFKGQGILSIVCILAAACVYILLAIYYLITQVHSTEDFLAMNGLIDIFKQTGVLMVGVGILMLTLVISYYIKDQKKAIRLMVILGMRSRTVYLVFGITFAVNVLLSGIIGVIIGCVISHLMREVLQSGLAYGGSAISLASAISWKTFGMGMLGYAIIALLSLGFNQTSVLNLACSMDMNVEVEKDRYSKRQASLIFAIGTVLLALAVRWYYARSWAESMYIHSLSALGILLLLLGGIRFYITRMEKNKDRYHKKIIAARPLYYRYWKSTWNLFYISIIHLFVLSVFAVQFAGAAVKQDTKALYPYDFVCMVFEDDAENVMDIVRKHKGVAEDYPMVRITSVYGSDRLAQWSGSRPVQYPQGQHSAISVSTYNSLKRALEEEPKQLDLSGNEMHVVYQQDLSVKAHTIDWDTSRVEKRLRIGQPLTYYNPADIDNVFPVWTIKSEERAILTGAFQQGMQENLVVFSDEYFKKEFRKISAYNEKQMPVREKGSFQDWRYYTADHTENMTEGATRMICINVPQQEYSGMLSDLGYLDAKYQFEKAWDDSIHPFYAKKQMVVDTSVEIFFKKLVYLFIVILLSVMGFFQYFVKFESEAKEIRWQNIFLERLGMREKERKKALTWQMKLFAVLPMVIGLSSGIIFTALTIRARLYEMAEIVSYVRIGCVIYLVYCCTWIAWYFWVKRVIWRQAEWEK